MAIFGPGDSNYVGNDYDEGIAKATGAIPNLTANQIDTATDAMKAAQVAARAAQQPAINTQVAADNTAIGVPTQTPQDVTNDFWNGNPIGAIWRSAGDNLTTLLGNSLMPPSTDMDPNFSPSEWTKQHGLQDYDAAFGSARNEQEAEAIRGKLAESITDNRLLSGRLPETSFGNKVANKVYGGLVAGTGLAFGLAKDPVGDIAMGGLGSIPEKLGGNALIKLASKTVAGMAIGGGYTYLQDKINDQDPQWGDIWRNALLSGGVGAIFHLKGKSAVETPGVLDTTASLPTPPVPVEGEPLSKGLAPLNPANTRQVTNNALQIWNKLNWLKSPAQDLMLSDLPMIREQALRTAETNNMTLGVQKGVEALPDAATQIWRDDVQQGENMIQKATTGLNTDVGKMTEEDLTPQVRAEAADRINQLNPRENLQPDDPNMLQKIDQYKGGLFNMIARDSEGSSIAAIEKNAAPARAKYLEQTQRRLDATPQEALSPQGEMFGAVDKPTANDLLEANTIMQDPAKVQGDEINYKIRAAKAAQNSGMGPSESEKFANTMYNRVMKLDTNSTSLPSGADMVEAANSSGLKGAQLKAAMLAFAEDSHQFQIDDPHQMFSAFQQAEAPDLALHEATGYMKTQQLRDEQFLPAVEKAKQILRENGSSNAEVAEAENRWKQQMDKLEDIRDVLSGKRFGGVTGGVPKDIMRLLRSAGVIVNLGGDLLAQSNAVFTMQRAFGLRPMLRTASNYIANNNDFRDMAQETGDRLGITLENKIKSNNHSYVSAVNQGIYQDMTARDIYDKMNGVSNAASLVKRLADGSQTAARVAQKINLTRYWQDTMRGWSGNIAQQMLLDSAKNVGENGWDALPLKEKQFAMLHGMGQGEMEGLSKEIGGAGVQDFGSGGMLADTTKFSNPDIGSKLDSATTKAAYTAVHSLNAGSLPTWMQNEYARTLMQFTSFAYAINNQYNVAGLQTHDKNFAGSLAGMALEQMMLIRLKEIARGQDPNKDRRNFFSDMLGVHSTHSEAENEISLFLGTIERMGIMGPSMEMARKIAEGVEPLMGSRADEGKAALQEIGGGPQLALNAGLALNGAIQAINQGRALTDKERNNIYDVLPLHNLFGVQWFKDIDPIGIAQDTLDEGNMWSRVHDHLGSTFDKVKTQTSTPHAAIFGPSPTEALQ